MVANGNGKYVRQLAHCEGVQLQDNNAAFGTDGKELAENSLLHCHKNGLFFISHEALSSKQQLYE